MPSVTNGVFKRDLMFGQKIFGNKKRRGHIPRYIGRKSSGLWVVEKTVFGIVGELDAQSVIVHFKTPNKSGSIKSPSLRLEIAASLPAMLWQTFSSMVPSAYTMR